MTLSAWASHPSVDPRHGSAGECDRRAAGRMDRRPGPAGFPRATDGARGRPASCLRPARPHGRFPGPRFSQCPRR